MKAIKIGSEEVVDQEEEEVEGEVEVVDPDIPVVRGWVIMPLDLLEMVAEGIMDLMAVLAHSHLHHMDHTLHHHKQLTVEGEDMVIPDYHQTHTLVVHHHLQTHMPEMRMEHLQQHMEDTLHHHHRHYRGMGTERMVLPHLTLILLLRGMVEVMGAVMEVDMVGTAEEEVVMEAEAAGGSAAKGTFSLCLDAGRNA